MNRSRFETLHLHVGHNKTGSSFLQTGLANSVSELERLGFAYPARDWWFSRMGKGQEIGPNIAPTPENIHETLGAAKKLPGLVLSAEAFFNRFRSTKTGQHPLLEALTAFVPVDGIRVLLYIRDPLDHAVSHYSQSVKGGRETRTFGEFLATYSTPIKVKSLLLDFEKHGLSCDIVNYSRHRKYLKTTFENWLGVPEGTMQIASGRVINRSLTRAELELQRKLNHFRQAHPEKTVSSLLSKKMPEIKSELPLISQDDLRKSLDRIQKLVDDPDLKQRIPSDAAYQVESFDRASARFLEPDTEHRFSFSADQLHLLAKIIGQSGGHGLDGAADLTEAS